jgi:hypothetical protein
MSDVSRVTLLRKRLGRAASSMKVIGLVSAFFVFIDLAIIDRAIIGLAIGIPMSWFAFRLSKHLRLGETSAVILSILWVVLFPAWQVVDPTSHPIQDIFNEQHDIKFKVNIIIMFIILCPSMYFVIRGALEMRAYQSALTSNPSRFEPLTLRPWEDKNDVRKHPIFLNKMSCMAYVFVILAPLLWIFAKLEALLSPGPQSNDTAYLMGWNTFQLVMGLAVMIWMAKLYRRGRRHAMVSGDRLLKKDHLDLVLYLRAFLDDSTIKMWARINDGRIFLERFIKISFEELVTDHLWRYGPVVAIGDPHTEGKLVPLGAARDFVPNDKNDPWKKHAADLMQKASIIVAVIHQTDGFLWEINTIVALGFKSKLVLLLPPIKAQDLVARWDYLVNHVKGTELPQHIDLEHARAVMFLEDQVVVITARERNDWTYETVLDNAAELILGNDVSEGNSVRAVGCAEELSAR